MSSIDRINAGAPRSRGREGRPAKAGLLSAIDHLCAEGRLDDEVPARFEIDWSLEQQPEVLALVGTITRSAFVENVARLPGEAFGARFLGS